MIKTSIIIPVYNTAEYLMECFDSVFLQTQKEIEVIAINDGSTDESLSILEEIKKEHPEMIIYSQENKGLGSARNKGIELARGEYIYFLDSDDCLGNTAMEECYRRAHINNLDVVMFDAVGFGTGAYTEKEYDRSDIISDKETVMSGEEFAEKYWLSCFHPNAVLMYFSGRFVKEHNLKFMDHIYYEDNEFYCKCIPLASRIMYIPQRLYQRRYRQNSITGSSFDFRHANDYLQMIQELNMHRNSCAIQRIMQDIKLRFIVVLKNLCVENNILSDTGFAKKLYETTLNICGGSIDKINTYAEIKILGDVCESMQDCIVSREKKHKILARKTEILKELLRGIPLGSENKYIGIYGMGKTASHFLSAYKKNMGELRATLFFIDSFTKTGEKRYQGYDVVNVNDIGNLKIDFILVASLKYEKNICLEIQKKYNDRFRMICLGADLRYWM